MENTLNLLLKDTALKWYTVMNARPAGPLSAKEIVQRIQAGELNFASHVWKEGFSGWTRIYDVIDFKPLLPGEPAASLIAEIQKSTQAAPPPLAPKQKEELRTWYLYLDEANYGPISDREVIGLLEAGRIGAGTHMWQKGFSDWLQMKDIDYWVKQLPSAKAKLPASDKRSTPRKPFETKILLTDGKEVGWAICRDISVGGMQVLMDQSPGPAGTALKLNVNPQGNVPGFACEGEVVRILEDGRGFSFRFTHLTSDAKSAIEKYISQ
ncbi:MAG: GYF domain-containing protein [Bacteriovoracia bacterium]